VANRHKPIKWDVNENGCWICTSHAPNSGRYPLVMVNGLREAVHRAMYRKTKGDIPGGKIVLHSCDTPKCCNPDHLRLGTPADNARDRKERGRNNSASNEANGRSKITDAQVAWIREHVEFTGVQIASKFGISTWQIGRIRSGKSRKP
jgi:hypothetical protein